jgi:hypothetical protein
LYCQITIWLGLEEQFIGNKETHAIILDAEFRTLVQGDLSVTDYCNKMKRMADALGTLGEPVLDRTLVLNVLRGLNEQYSHMAAMIKRTRLFPSYSDVRADLLIEEVTLASKTTTPTAVLDMGPSSLGEQLQHHDAHSSADQQLVYGLRCFLSHGLKLRLPIPCSSSQPFYTVQYHRW